MTRKIVFIVLITLLLSNIGKAISENEVEIINRLKFDKEIMLNYAVVHGDYVYIPALGLPLGKSDKALSLDIYFYSMSKHVFEKKISYYPRLDSTYLVASSTPRLHVYEDTIFFVDRLTRSVIFVDQTGKIVREIYLRNTYPHNEVPGNPFDMVFDGKDLYLNNRFYKEKAYLLQQYNLGGNLIHEIDEQFPFIKLAKDKRNLYAIYIDSVLKLDDQLQIIDTFKLKGNSFDIESSYLFHKNLFFALDSKLILHVTDFITYYREINLNNYLNLAGTGTANISLFNNSDTIILMDNNSNTIYELKFHL